MRAAGQLSKREFLKAGSALLATWALRPARGLAQDDLPDFVHVSPYPLEEYPYRSWEQVYRDQLAADRSFPVHLGYGRYSVQIRGDSAMRLEPWVGPEGASGAAIGGERAYSALRRLYGRARIDQPLLRKGFVEGKEGRGSGDWEEISWEQAYDLLARKILEVARETGPESIKLVTASLASGPVSKQGSIIRFANMLGSTVWLDRDSSDLPNLSGASSFYFENSTSRGEILRRIHFESPIPFIQGRERRPTRIRWHVRHDFLTRCGSLSRVLTERDPQVELIVAQAPEFDLTCEYADLVLPVHTEFEATLPDLALLARPRAVDIARGGLAPLHQSRMDLEIAAGVARRMSEISKETRYADYWQPTPEAFIERVLDASAEVGGVKLSDLANGPQPLVGEGARAEPSRGRTRPVVLPPEAEGLSESLPEGALYLTVVEGRHSFGTQWGLSDMNQVLAGGFGDPWKTEPRSPGLAEAALEIHPADARSRSISDGDYVWVDPTSGTALDPSLRTLVRCQINPAIPEGLALTREGWHAAIPATRAAQSDSTRRAVTLRGYVAHYRSGGVQYLVSSKGELAAKSDPDGALSTSLSSKSARVTLTRAEDGKYGPARSGYAVVDPGSILTRYLHGELSRST